LDNAVFFIAGGRPGAPLSAAVEKIVHLNPAKIAGRK